MTSFVIPCSNIPWWWKSSGIYRSNHLGAHNSHLYFKPHEPVMVLNSDWEVVDGKSEIPVRMKNLKETAIICEDGAVTMYRWLEGALMQLGDVMQCKAIMQFESWSSSGSWCSTKALNCFRALICIRASNYIKMDAWWLDFLYTHKKYKTKTPSFEEITNVKKNMKWPAT